MRPTPSTAEPLCEYCASVTHPGIIVPSWHGDRGPSTDGRVWVMRCDECKLYSDDVEAAEALHEMTGWEVGKSLDRNDSCDDELREQAKTKNESWFRPFVKVPLKLAQTFGLLET